MMADKAFRQQQSGNGGGNDGNGSSVRYAHAYSDNVQQQQSPRSARVGHHGPLPPLPTSQAAQTQARAAQIHYPSNNDIEADFWRLQVDDRQIPSETVAPPLQPQPYSSSSINGWNRQGTYQTSPDTAEHHSATLSSPYPQAPLPTHVAPASVPDAAPTPSSASNRECYSPLCGQANVPANATCYSSSCPRSSSASQLDEHLDAILDDLADQYPEVGESSSNNDTASLAPPPTSATTPKSSMSPSAVAGASHNAVAWADTVPSELLATLSKDEIKRQNAILELIQKDEEFLNDLELLDTLFLTQLFQSAAVTNEQSPLADEHERESFVREVFSNHRELCAQIRQLVELLHERQREDGPVVKHIGDIYLQAALEWQYEFEMNMTNFPMAKQRSQREAMRNPLYAAFLEECRSNPACHRLPIDHFLQRATTRLPRYNLHFKTILKDTDEASADRESLQRAIELIDEQCKAIQKGVAAADVKVKIREYAYNLASKRNKVAIHMDLLNPERQLVHSGRVYRKPAFNDFEWQEMQAALFDNYLVVTKTKRHEEGDRSISRFVLEKRPIAVEMMHLYGFSDAPISRSIGLSNLHLRSDRENRDAYPFTIAHIAGKMEPLTLYTSTRAERDEWKTKIDEAIGLRSAVQEANRLFEIGPISSDLFALPPTSAFEQAVAEPSANAPNFHGVVSCAIPFRTRDGRRLIAIGCADGVWIGLRNDAKSLRKVLHLKLVMQCAVLEDFGIFVVLADKVLISYSLDALVPSAHSPNDPRPPQRLSGNRDVMFFTVGKMRERTLLVYVKKRPNESIFRALEPLAVGARGDHGSSGGSSSVAGGLFSRFGSSNRSSGWFREFKTFFIPSEAFSMQFLRSKLCIVCARGFEIIDLDNLIPGTIPDFSSSNREDPRIIQLSRRIEASKPLGMFKNQEGEFLLCYDGFACFVDRRGSPIKLEQAFEWEGIPNSVAFKEPFILAFDSRFIEVRDSASGQLVQLIRTNELRNISFSSSTISDEEEAVLLVQRIRSGARGAFDYQQIFELLATSTYQHHIRSLSLQRHRSPSGGNVSTYENASIMGGGMPGAMYLGGDRAAYHPSVNANGFAGGTGALAAQMPSASGSLYEHSTPSSFYAGSSSSFSPTLRRQGTTATMATTATNETNSSNTSWTSPTSHVSSPGPGPGHAPSASIATTAAATSNSRGNGTWI